MTAIEFGPAWSASLARGAEAELRGWVDAGLAWCVETDAIAMRHFRKTTAERKPDRTFVTVADTAIEKRLRERIGAAFPKHGIVGEELGDEAPKDKAGTRWWRRRPPALASGCAALSSTIRCRSASATSRCASVATSSDG